MRMIQTTKHQDFRKLLAELKSKDYLFPTDFLSWRIYKELTVFCINDSLRKFHLLSRQEIHGMDIYRYEEGIVNSRIWSRKREVKVVLSKIKKPTKTRQDQINDILNDIFEGSDSI